MVKSLVFGLRHVRPGFMNDWLSFKQFRYHAILAVGAPISCTLPAPLQSAMQPNAKNSGEWSHFPEDILSALGYTLPIVMGVA
jgi:hypothetical protein